MQKATICGLEPTCAVYRLPTDTGSSRDSHFMGCEVQAKTEAQDIHRHSHLYNSTAGGLIECMNGLLKQNFDKKSVHQPFRNATCQQLYRY